MKFKLGLLAVTAITAPLAFASIAKAQPVTGPYVSLGVGVDIANPANANVSDTTMWDRPTGRNSPDTGSNTRGVEGNLLAKLGVAGVGGIGYGFGNGFRVELGGNYFYNDFSKFDGNLYDYGHNTNPGGTTTWGPNNSPQFKIHTGGGENTYGPMVNGYYDMNIGYLVYPYVGAGVGYQWVKIGPDVAGMFGGTKGSFAFDLIGGVSYPIAAVPGLSLTAEYRFMMLTESRNFETYSLGSYTNPDTGYSRSETLRTHLGQQSFHTFTIGLRYQLFNPPPIAPAPAAAPVAAAPAPVPAKTYLVFFDWDKYNLTPRAAQVIAQAASDSKTQATTTIDVNGYTDTSGTPVYNKGLSIRRAKAVAGQLVTDGVPASEITAQGFGDTNLLVPTGPGVREPQNRRVEIILQ